MEETKIRKYAELMRELGLSGLEISENGTTVHLERKVATNEPISYYELKEDIQSAASAGTFDFRSPMVGVFYRASAETEAPFVKVGDTVHKGDVLCIIEAMKLMNEIVAEQDGTVAEICAENNQVVDFGHVLFRFRKDKA